MGVNRNRSSVVLPLQLSVRKYDRGSLWSDVSTDEQEGENQTHTQVIWGWSSFISLRTIRLQGFLKNSKVEREVKQRQRKTE
jgi:hypothetical protein